MQDSVLPADQVTRLACLLGRAVLRWQRDRNANAKSSEIVSDSLPERLESRPVSSLSVSGRNDRATGSFETGSRHETGDVGVDRSETSPKLVVNADEAAKVREIFDYYLKLRSLLPVVQKLEELGWANKMWLTRKGRHKGGRPFDKCSVHSLLTNVLYIGRIRHKENVYDGVHEPIIQPDVFDAVQKMLKEHGQGSGKRLINRHNAMLKGLLFCPACGYAMAHSPTKKKNKLYRYYVCQTAIKRGHDQCRTGSIPAPAIEAAVIESLRCIVDDDGLKREIYKQSEHLIEQRQERLDLQLRQLTKQRSRDKAELKRMATEGEAGDLNDARRHDLQMRIERTRTQIKEVTDALAIAGQQRFSRDDVDEALGDFDQLWKMLKARERVQLLELLVSRVQYDRSDGTLAISYHPTAITALIKNGEEEAE